MFSLDIFMTQNTQHLTLISLSIDSPNFSSYSLNIRRRVCGTCDLWEIVIFWVPIGKFVRNPLSVCFRLLLLFCGVLYVQGYGAV